jgi:hypothetical protein
MWESAGLLFSNSTSMVLDTSMAAWTASGGFITSDRRYKRDILPLDNALETVEKLRGVSFLWDRDTHPEIDLLHNSY